MIITRIYIYPIKSLRGILLTSANPTAHGLVHDRRFMLLRRCRRRPPADGSGGDGGAWENMLVGKISEMALFTQQLRHRPDDGVAVAVLVGFGGGGKSWEGREMAKLEVALEPDIKGLEPIDVVLHGSGTKAYRMGERYDRWFSECFGYEVILVYLGPHLRPVLGNVAPGSNSITKMDKNKNAAIDTCGSWMSRVTKAVPASLGSIWSQRSQTAGIEEGITFADMAPYLVVTEESLRNVSARLPKGVEMDVTKFRPNIVLSGSAAPWEEDFWGGLTIRAKAGNGGEVCDNDGDNDEDELVQRNDRIIELVLTSNCARCQSINVDYETGKHGTGEKGSVLKKLMHDRRVDKGMKYSPVFGRYAFLVPPPTSTTTHRQLRPERAAGRSKISVGDEVFVSKRNESRTTVGKTTLLPLRACGVLLTMSDAEWPGLAGQ